jgi:hypothetical protein
MSEDAIGNRLPRGAIAPARHFPKLCPPPRARSKGVAYDRQQPSLSPPQPWDEAVARLRAWPNNEQSRMRLLPPHRPAPLCFT